MAIQLHNRCPEPRYMNRIHFFGLTEESGLLSPTKILADDLVEGQIALQLVFVIKRVESVPLSFLRDPEVASNEAKGFRHRPPSGLLCQQGMLEWPR